MPTKPSPELQAIVEYLAANGRSSRDSVVAYAMRFVDPARAIRTRDYYQQHQYRGGYVNPISDAAKVEIGRRTLVNDRLDSAFRRGKIVRHDDGTLELVRRTSA